jgi:hypothetical protein
MLDLLKAFSSHLENTELTSCFAGITKIAGYQITKEERTPFLHFHNHITNPQPKYITNWREAPKNEHFYIKLVDGILHTTQGTYGCLKYHQENITNIEMEMVKCVEQVDFKKILGNSSVMIGNTQKWDYEYQAYVLTYRRCLDQFANALSTFFKNQANSFRTFDKYLKSQKIQQVALPLAEIHAKHIKNFEFVMSEGGARSVRDTIAHYQFVPAGVLNLTPIGIVFAGGGENMFLNSAEPTLLSKILENKTAALHACLSEMIFSFVQEVEKWETGS